MCSGVGWGVHNNRQCEVAKAEKKLGRKHDDSRRRREKWAVGASGHGRTCKEERSSWVGTISSNA